MVFSVHASGHAMPSASTKQLTWSQQARCSKRLADHAYVDKCSVTSRCHDIVICDPHLRCCSITPVQAKLLKIHRNTQQLRRQRHATDLVLALNRSDYMLDEPSGTLMQVNPCLH